MTLPPPRPTSVPQSDAHHQQALNYSTLAATAAAVAASAANSSIGSGGVGGGGVVVLGSSVGSGVGGGNNGRGDDKIEAAGPHSESTSLSSTETLLRNIQSLLTVAADNARQQERQITYEKGK